MVPGQPFPSSLGPKVAFSLCPTESAGSVVSWIVGCPAEQLASLDELSLIECADTALEQGAISVSKILSNASRLQALDLVSVMWSDVSLNLLLSSMEKLHSLKRLSMAVEHADGESFERLCSCIGRMERLESFSFRCFQWTSPESERVFCDAIQRRLPTLKNFSLDTCHSRLERLHPDFGKSLGDVLKYGGGLERLDLMSGSCAHVCAGLRFLDTVQYLEITEESRNPTATLVNLRNALGVGMPRLKSLHTVQGLCMDTWDGIVEELKKRGSCFRQLFIWVPEDCEWSEESILHNLNALLSLASIGWLEHFEYAYMRHVQRNLRESTIALQMQILECCRRNVARHEKAARSCAMLILCRNFRKQGNPLWFSLSKDVYSIVVKLLWSFRNEWPD